MQVSHSVTEFLTHSSADEAVEEETGNPVQGGIEADLADDENAEDTAFEESEEVETEELSEDESESTDETDNGEDA